MNRALPSPGTHNRHQASEKSLDRVMKGWMRIHTPGGRRRKKHIAKVEGANLRVLVAAVANDLRAQRAPVYDTAA